MTVTARRLEATAVAAGLAGLAVSVAARVRMAGAAGAASVPAGFTFGVLLAVLAAALGFDPSRPTWRQVAWGVAGAAVLCVPVALHRLGHPGVAADGAKLPVWAAGVTFVALAEEALLRGALYKRLRRVSGPAVTIGVTAVAFALLHAPVYGWRVVPLDLAVGIWLGVARHVTGSVTAPAIIHTLADLAGWWLR